MPQYEVKFLVNEPHELNDAEVAELAHTVYDRLKPIVKPEGRKVYISRVYTATEERAIVKKHAANDKLEGRDWQIKGQGCSCHLCNIYRGFGTVIK